MVYMLFAALLVGPRRWQKVAGFAGLAMAALLMYLPPRSAVAVGDAPLYVAGLQTEGWNADDIATALDQLAAAHPEARLLVLSEYAFSGPVPPVVRDVVRKHRVFLIAGGRERVNQHVFYNTAFVIDPDGHDVFRQGKSVPVPFFNDGQPAVERRIWESPWGKIGIAICFDAGFARVMDDFVRQGACCLIIPTMDIASWGEFERRMVHGRIAPIRSAEYGIPTFGVWSSGVSQLTDRFGYVMATAGYPGQGEIIRGPLDLSRPGRLPPDRPFAWAAMWGTAAFIVYIVLISKKPPAATTTHPGLP
jgi:apolipoprotein N-acyltransferase